MLIWLFLRFNHLLVLYVLGQQFCIGNKQITNNRFNYKLINDIFVEINNILIMFFYMKYLKLSVGIILAISLSRFVPHPPNFTSFLALSFYVPALFGLKFIPILVLAFALTDFLIGFHKVVFFTWGSVIFIGLISNFFIRNMFSRVTGSLIGAFIFFVVSNFGVWSLGSYGYSVNGLINCFVLALPFFSYSLISTFIYSTIIETIIWLYSLKKIFLIKKNNKNKF